jgi:hypothetical protein
MRRVATVCAVCAWRRGGLDQAREEIFAVMSIERVLDRRMGEDNEPI